MHGVGTKARLVPEEDVCPLFAGLSGQRGEDLALPAFDGFGIALQRLLGREPQPGQQVADGGQPQRDAGFLLDELLTSAPVDPPDAMPSMNSLCVDLYLTAEQARLRIKLQALRNSIGRNNR